MRAHTSCARGQTGPASSSASLGLQVPGVEEGVLPSRGGGEVGHGLEAQERVDSRRFFAGVLNLGDGVPAGRGVA
jgi:hypothetical protein